MMLGPAEIFTFLFVMPVDALRVEARLQLVRGCRLEGDVGAYSCALLSVFQRHQTNSVVLSIRRR